MTEEAYSPSRLKKYRDCPLAFRLRYIDRAQGKGHSLESFRGTCIHTALEYYHERQMLEGVFAPSQSLVDAYYTTWDTTVPEDLFCAKPNMSVSQFRSAGEVFLRQYYTKNIGTWSPTRHTLAVEKDVVFPLTHSNGETRTIRCIIDRVDYHDEALWEIIDYKTGNYVPSQKQLDTDLQLGLYYWAVGHAFPDVGKRLLSWKYIAHGKDVFSERTPEAAQKLADSVIDLIKDIEAFRASGQEWLPVESVLCSWCEYAHLCPLKAHGLHVRGLEPPQRPLDAGVQLVESGNLLGWDADAKSRVWSFGEEHGVSVIEGMDVRARLLSSGDVSIEPLEHKERRC